MEKIIEILKSYNVSNISSSELIVAATNFYPVLEVAEKHDKECVWDAVKGFHEHIKGKHFDEKFAMYQVKEMYHTKHNGTICRGEIFNIEEAKRIYDKYVRNIDSSNTCWDVYVAINSQYHDYIKFYKEQYTDMSDDDIKERIIKSAIVFWFKDEDAEVGKVWDYFKGC